jgi:3-isopropylmalate/(R)-2-methylmalate dehydratase large subunit
VSAKDIILNPHLASHGATATFEYRGEAIRALTMEQRMTIRMSHRGRCASRLIALTIRPRVPGRRPHAPAGAAWDAAVDRWRGLPSDDGATFDKAITIDADALEPMVTYGTNPGMGIPITGNVLARRAGRPGPAPRPRARPEYMDAPRSGDPRPEGRRRLCRKLHERLISDLPSGRRAQGPAHRRRGPTDASPAATR